MFDTLINLSKNECGSFFENLVTTGYCHTNNIGHTAATYNENTYLHIDWWMKRLLDYDRWSIDTKAPKKMCRGDDEFTRNVLLEYTGIKGYPGWLRGQADKIGFYLPNENYDGFELWAFERSELLKFVSNIGDPTTPHHYRCAPNTMEWLQRYNSQDSFIWVPIDVLKESVPHYSVSDVTNIVRDELKNLN